MSASGNLYCRFCAQSKPQDMLIELKTHEKTLEDLLNKLIRLNCFFDYEQNILPITICLPCINSLNNAFVFVESFENAQLVLKNIITTQSIKKEIEDSGVYKLSNEQRYEVTIEYDEQKLQEDEESSNNNTPLGHCNLTWQDYKWMCSYCESQFCTITELKNHSMEYHNSCGAYRCTECNITKLRLDRFITHVRRHREYLKTSCYRCFKVFSSTYDTNKHKVEHEITNFKCNGCNTCFVSLEKLKNHTDRYYKNAFLDKKFQEDFTCPICGKTYKTSPILKHHMLTHTDRRRTHTCETCGKTFLSNQNLVTHVKSHEDARPFECEVCKISFKTKEHLKVHVGIHDAKKPFECEECGKGFRLKKHLKSHSIIHTDKLPYICTYCNKGFRFRAPLIQHKRQHTGVKPYKCDICEKQFTNHTNYSKHMRIKHNIDISKRKQLPKQLNHVDPATEHGIHIEID